MNIAKTTLLWWSFFMPRRLAYIILIYTSLTQSSFSQDILSIINDEQTNHLYFICNDIYKYTNTKYIKIAAANHEKETHSVINIINLLKTKLSKEEFKGSEKIMLFEKKDKALKTGNISGLKFFAFSDVDGQKILKFDCTLMKFGRKKIGPFEIPSNKHILIDPEIEFFIKI
jgi:hypothetical protein|tara:strand:- start:267 stop:782 length:516 start_codon:yes stop_codon:yes gene_type:complete